MRKHYNLLIILTQLLLLLLLSILGIRCIFSEINPEVDNFKNVNSVLFTSIEIALFIFLSLILFLVYQRHGKEQYVKNVILLMRKIKFPLLVILALNSFFLFNFIHSDMVRSWSPFKEFTKPIFDLSLIFLNILLVTLLFLFSIKGTYEKISDITDYIAKLFIYGWTIVLFGRILLVLGYIWVWSS